MREVDVRFERSDIVGKRRAFVVDVATGQQVEAGELVYSATLDEVTIDAGRGWSGFLDGCARQESCYFFPLGGFESELVKVRRWIPDARTRRSIRRRLALVPKSA